MKIPVATIILLLFLSAPYSAGSATVEYDLDIDYKTVNMTGRPVAAMAVNGSIPGPVLRFTEGDHAVIRVHNHMREETSVHWHGILLPNRFDGVPYVTTMPIKPGGSHTFTFDLKHSGTYWYHSHTNLQEQSGIYGGIVIEPKKKKIKVDHDLVLMLSDWTDENPLAVLRTLKRGSEWYSIRKGTAQSWDRVIKNHAIIGRLKQSLMRMPPMDVSDIAYDRFLVNGRPEIRLEQIKPGQKVRLRVINGAASTYFRLNYAGGPLRIINADGMEVTPTTTSELPVAVAETYDLLLTAPENGAMELRATAVDGSGHASVIIGRGTIKKAPDITPPNPFRMMKSGHKTGGMGHGKTGMTMHGKGNGRGQGEKFTYARLRSPRPTALPRDNPVREVVLELTGNMERYQWSLNNIPLSEADKILIRRGENVRFKLVNRTMMSHPMHLHGHFFRVLNGQGDYAPLKHTVDVAPLATTTIEFLADEDKDWFFHCHILYHLMSGMARVVHYQGSEIDPALAEAKKRGRTEIDDDHFFTWGEAAVESHMASGMLKSSNNRNEFGLDWDSDWESAYDISPWYGRYLSRFLTVFIGGEFNEDEKLGVAGIRYVLPLYIETELRIDDNGDFRLTGAGEIQLLPRLAFTWNANTDDEWRYGVEWRISKTMALTASHDSDYDAGGGIRIRF